MAPDENTAKRKKLNLRSLSLSLFSPRKHTAPAPSPATAKVAAASAPAVAPASVTATTKTTAVAAKAPVAAASASSARPVSALQRPAAAALPTPQQLLLQQQQQLQQDLPIPQRPPPINAEAANSALQRAADSAAAAVRAAVPKVENYGNANPERRKQLDAVALSGQPGFNKSALRLSPNDVGTLSQALQAANTVKTFLAALPSAAQQASWAL